MASKSITLNPKEIARRLAIRKEINARKMLLKQRIAEMKRAKEKYKEKIADRREKRTEIGKTYEDKKEEIKQVKLEKARQLGENVRNIPGKVVETVRKNTVDRVTGAIDTARAFIDGVAGNGKEKDADDERE